MTLVTLLGGQPVTTTWAIAAGTDLEHASVIKLARTYCADLEEFGGVRFEIQPFETAGGIQQREIACLNEQQATLLLTYLRNSAIVRAFKKRLVKAFYDMAGQIARPMIPQTFHEALRLAADLAEQKAALEAAVVAQAPKVEFHDAVTNAINAQTIQEVAKVLSTGANRLFDFLRKGGMLMANNLPYQTHIEAGHFRVVERKYKDGRGEDHTYTRTLVTGKGLTYIQKRLAKAQAEATA